MYFLKISTTRENAETSFPNIEEICSSFAGTAPAIEPNTNNDQWTVLVPFPATIEQAEQILSVLGEDISACTWEAPKIGSWRFMIEGVTIEQAHSLISEAMHDAGCKASPNVIQADQEGFVSVRVPVPKGHEVVYHQVAQAFRDAGWSISESLSGGSVP